MSDLPRMHNSCRLALITILASLLLGLFSTLAAASTEPGGAIEGVWSFNGGAVAVTMRPDGSFQGTVVRPTKFASCEHPVGQVVWSDMRVQPDNSYWGFHRWYRGTKCKAIAKPGLTAWRVLVESNGTPSLRVCFSKPSSSLQPTIARDGTGAHYTYGCQSLSLVAPVPSTTPSEEPNEELGSRSALLSFQNVVKLPAATTCLSKDSLWIGLRSPTYDPLRRVTVKIANRKVLYLHGVNSITSGVALSPLPSGSFKVSVLTDTVLKQQLAGSQTYTSCPRTRAGAKRSQLRATRWAHAREREGGLLTLS